MGIKRRVKRRRPGAVHRSNFGTKTHETHSRYLGKECSAGFHVYEAGSMEGATCLCGNGTLTIEARGFIKIARAVPGDTGRR